jgi:hypothetical protein
MNVPRRIVTGDVRTHIRIPGSNFMITIHRGDDVVYAAVNASSGASGNVLVRWKVPCIGKYRVTLWRQRDRVTTTTEFHHVVKTKITSFEFTVV